MLEKQIEAYLVLQCKKRRWLCYKFTSPNRRSVPDRLIVVYPSGHVAFVEIKRPGAKPTPKQHLEMTRLLDAGADVSYVNSMEGVDECLLRLETINKTLCDF